MTNHREYVSTHSTGLKTDSWCANSSTDSIAVKSFRGVFSDRTLSTTALIAKNNPLKTCSSINNSVG